MDIAEGAVNAVLLFEALGTAARCFWSSLSRLVAVLRAAAGIRRVGRRREAAELPNALEAAAVSLVLVAEVLVPPDAHVFTN